MIENYSRYKLLHPTQHSYYPSAKIIKKVEEINERSSAMFVLDNGGYKDYTVSGSMSWQIHGPNGEPQEQRLIVTYNIPYK